MRRKMICHLLLTFALAFLPLAAALAQVTEGATSNLQAAETLADEIQKQVDTDLSGFGAQLACQSVCQFLDAGGVCQRKLMRTEQEQRMPSCSWPNHGNFTEQQNVDVFMCNERIPRNDWTTIAPCQVCSMTTSYFCSGTSLITRTTCSQNGSYRDSAPDEDHPWCGCSSTYQSFSCSGSTGVYTNYCRKDNRYISQSYWGSHPSCVPPPAYATRQSCGQSYVFKCGKYHCAYVWANMDCSGLQPGQSCIGAGTFDDGYITLNANCWWCMQGNSNGCCPTGCI